MLDIVVGLSHVELAVPAVFGPILAGVVIRSLAGAVTHALSRRGASASEGG